jgi:hypothetical protein
MMFLKFCKYEKELYDIIFNFNSEVDIKTTGEIFFDGFPVVAPRSNKTFVEYRDYDKYPAYHSHIVFRPLRNHRHSQILIDWLFAENCNDDFNIISKDGKWFIKKNNKKIIELAEKNCKTLAECKVRLYLYYYYLEENINIIPLRNLFKKINNFDKEFYKEEMENIQKRKVDD